MDPNLSSRIPVNIEDEMKRSYMDYAMSVIIGRALPDVRDGLKPANRRVLFAMRQMGLASNRAYRKCAKIVGEVIGNYHPHGDAPAYDTLVRLAQDFNMRYPLVDGQGNFGSVDGDPPAAYRYTEARLESLAEAMMADLDKDTVDFRPNFDETTEEPTVFPTPPYGHEPAERGHPRSNRGRHHRDHHHLPHHNGLEEAAGGGCRLVRMKQRRSRRERRCETGGNQGSAGDNCRGRGVVVAQLTIHSNLECRPCVCSVAIPITPSS